MELVNGISADGSTIVGFNNPGSSQTAVRWSASTGVQTFGDLQGTPFSGPFVVNRMFEANATNHDGSIITGSARVQVDFQIPIATIRILPFIWDATNGARLLTNANGSMFLDGASASDMTSDGAWIVGNSTTGFYRWKQSTGFEFFSLVAGSQIGDRPRVSDNGETIIFGANYWTTTTGVQTLTQILTQANCNFTGWTNLSAIDISADGLTLAGNGTNPQGQFQGWIATIPSPGAVWVALAAWGVAARRRRAVGVR